jgi:methionyl-tRNA formyltransferase
LRVVILTSLRRSLASRCLPALCESSRIQVVGVLFARHPSADKWKLAKRKVAKTLRIGFLGALNGIRMRSWYADRGAQELSAVCASLNVPIAEVDSVNSDEMKNHLRQASADLGLSIGNSYIAPSVFGLPKHGMINVHTEILPRFQGAQSVIWPIFERSHETGFTIHQVNQQLDGGAILHQKRHLIRFWPTLRETVVNNLETVRSKIPAALVHVCENYQELRAQGATQASGRSYTTPTIREFRRMVQNHRAMFRETLGRRMIDAPNALSIGGDTLSSAADFPGGNCR